MANVLVVQIDPLAPAGHFGLSLLEAGANLTQLQVFNEDERQAIDLSTYQGLLVLGGRVNAYDDSQQALLKYVTDLINDFHRAEKGVFGICLGAQLLAKALGSAPRSNHGWEVGFTDLVTTSEAALDPVFQDLPPTCRLLEMHEDSFYLPDDAQLLLSGNQCTNQAFKVGRASYGVQFHPEADESIVTQWIAFLRNKSSQEGEEMAQTMQSNLPTEYQAQQAICHTLAKGWLSLI